VSDYAAWLRFRVAWLWWWAKDTARDTWRDIPGPLPVKIVLAIVLGFMAITPGPDEVIAFALIKLMRWLLDTWHARHAPATLTQTWDESAERLICC
jgi:hypothetical protein